jgi:hypothetical protein
MASATPRVPTARAAASARPPLFKGVILGGFECSCHRLVDGRRLDLLASTRHDELADADYARLRSIGLQACRDGISWVRAERSPGAYDFSSAEPMVRAADRHEIQVSWDLMHFGWPDDIDIFSPAFVDRFARYAKAFAQWLSRSTDQVAMITPINEMSFLSWGGGDVKYMNPFASGRGFELKSQLVRATIEAMEAIWSVLPSARFLQPEPLVQIVSDTDDAPSRSRATEENLLQYQAWDMMIGADSPALGGHPKYLDVVGVNFYPYNQFTRGGVTIHRPDPRYAPFSRMLLDTWARYRRPMLVAETGCEGDARPSWLRYVSGECIAAIGAGCDLHGVTLYPIVNHPGWGDDRHCHNGLWDYADAAGHRAVYAPLLEEIRIQAARLDAARSAGLTPAESLEAGSAP